MKNKKTIMFFSAIFVLIFHLWINITNTYIENYLRLLCVIGVDIFFFVSAYSISKKDSINYKEFICNRFNNIYIKFILFSIIYYFISSWNLKKLIFTILGLDFISNGGGSFLWFIPGIMFIYLLIPFYSKLYNKNNKLTLLFSIIIYISLLVILNIFINYKQIFIFYNRIPILLLGFYFGKYGILEKLNKKNYIILTLLCLIIGFIISYYVFYNKIRFSFIYDFNYFINIIIEIGIILLLNLINSNKVINIISTCTLEIYAIQMIYGFKLANNIYKLIRIPLISNLLTIILIIIISIIFNKIYNFIYNKIKLLY